MKRSLPLLFIPSLLLAQIAVQKDYTGTISNGNVVVGNATMITVSGTGQIAATSIPTISITPTTPLTGGGALTGNVTLGISNIPNATLANSTITVAGKSIALGSAATLAASDLTNGTSGTGAVVLASGASLVSPNISSIVNVGALTLPTSTDTLVGRATTDTLTNKSISGATNTFTAIPNSALTNSSLTVAGHTIALGSSATLSASDLTNGTTGTGSVVLATGATLVTPNLGTPSAAVLTNATGLPLTTGVTGFLPVTNSLTYPNATPSAYLRDWHRAVYQLLTGTSTSASILVIGDSWSSMPTGWLSYADPQMKQVLGDNGAGYVGFEGFSPANPNAATITRTGSWVITTNTGRSVQKAELTSSTIGDVVTVALAAGQSATNPVLHYLSTSGGGSFEYRFNGGAWSAPVSTSAASDTYSTLALTGTPSGNWTLDVQVSAGGTSGVTLFGVDCADSASGVRILDVAYSGYKATDYLSGNTALWESGVSALNPTMAIIFLGTNDRGVVTPTQFAANVVSIVNNLRAVRAGMDILLVGEPENLGGGTYPMSQYRDAIQAAAASNACGFIDLLPNFGQSVSEYNDSSPRVLFSSTNTIHPTALGFQQIAEVMQSALLGTAERKGGGFTYISSGKVSLPSATDAKLSLNANNPSGNHAAYIEYIRSTTGAARTWWLGTGLNADDSFNLFDSTRGAFVLSADNTGKVSINSTSLASSSPITGALVIGNNVGFSGVLGSPVYLGGDMDITSSSNRKLSITSGGVPYIELARTASGTSRTWWLGVGIDGTDACSLYDFTRSAYVWKVDNTGAFNIQTSTDASTGGTASVTTQGGLYAAKKVIANGGSQIGGANGVLMTRVRHGTATLSAGTVTVSDANVTANTRIFLTSQVDGGTPGWLRVSARTAGTSFTITSSSATDTSTVGYIEIEP